MKNKNEDEGIISKILVFLCLMGLQILLITVTVIALRHIEQKQESSRQEVNLCCQCKTI